MFQLNTGERLTPVLPLAGAFLLKADGGGLPFIIKGKKRIKSGD